VRDNPHAGT